METPTIEEQIYALQIMCENYDEAFPESKLIGNARASVKSLQGLAACKAENERLERENWKLKIATGNSLQTIEDIETAAVAADRAKLLDRITELLKQA